MIKGKVRLTKESILEKVSQEQVMEYYSGVPLRSGNFCSPFRVDRKPSCGYYYSNDNILYLNDLTGQFKGTCFGVAAKRFGLSSDGYVPPYIESQLYDLINQDIQKGNIKAKASHWIYKRSEVVEKKASSVRTISWKLRKWEDYDKDYWQSYKVHDTSKWLDLYQVIPVRYIWINNIRRNELDSKPDNPTYLYKIWTVDGYHYKIYKPLDDTGYNKWRSTGNGSREHPVIQGLKQLDDNKEHICISSLKDAMHLTALDLGVDGYAYNSESFIPNSLEPNTIAYFADNDDPGLEQAKKMNDKLKVPIIYLHKDTGCKDLSDLLKMYDLKYCKKIVTSLINDSRNKRNY